MNTQIQSLVRRYGYGVPDVERALLSTRNDLTLIVQDELQPFQREGTAAAKTRDMKLHRLPWPKDELAAAGDAQVELRVLLSYSSSAIPANAVGLAAIATLGDCAFG